MEKPFYIISTKGERDREFQTSNEALDAMKSSPSDSTLYRVDIDGVITAYIRKH